MKYLSDTLAAKMNSAECRSSVPAMARMVDKDFAIFSARVMLSSHRCKVAEYLRDHLGWIELKDTGEHTIRVARQSLSAKERALFSTSLQHFNLVGNEHLARARVDVVAAVARREESRLAAAERYAVSKSQKALKQSEREKKGIAWGKDLHAFLMGTKTARRLAMQAFAQEQNR